MCFQLRQNLSTEAVYTCKPGLRATREDQFVVVIYRYFMSAVIRRV